MVFGLVLLLTSCSEPLEKYRMELTHELGVSKVEMEAANDTLAYSLGASTYWLMREGMNTANVSSFKIYSKTGKVWLGDSLETVLENEAREDVLAR